MAMMTFKDAPRINGDSFVNECRKREWEQGKHEEEGSEVKVEVMVWESNREFLW